jgi:hypothetical protein
MTIVSVVPNKLVPAATAEHQSSVPIIEYNEQQHNNIIEDQRDDSTPVSTNRCENSLKRPRSPVQRQPLLEESFDSTHITSILPLDEEQEQEGEDENDEESCIKRRRIGELNNTEMTRCVCHSREYTGVIPDRIPNKDYMNQQPDLSAFRRFIVVNWMLQVAIDIHLKDNNTVYLAINMLDRVLSRIRIRRTKFQLLGVTTLLLAW